MRDRRSFLATALAGIPLAAFASGQSPQSATIQGGVDLEAPPEFWRPLRCPVRGEATWNRLSLREAPGGLAEVRFGHDDGCAAIVREPEHALKLFRGFAREIHDAWELYQAVHG